MDQISKINPLFQDPVTNHCTTGKVCSMDCRERWNRHSFDPHSHRNFLPNAAFKRSGKGIPNFGSDPCLLNWVHKQNAEKISLASAKLLAISRLCEYIFYPFPPPKKTPFFPLYIVHPHSGFLCLPPDNRYRHSTTLRCPTWLRNHHYVKDPLYGKLKI